ncbi:MAG: HPF/RaiA family ribosome-associated protein [Myxococcales bacterium]
MVVHVRTLKQKLDDTTLNFLSRRVVGRLLRFYDRPDADLTIELIGRQTPKRDNRPECRLTLHLPRVNTQHVEQAGADMLQAIDLAGDRLERLVKREIEWLRKRNPHKYRRRPRTSVRVPDSAMPPNLKYYP